MSDSEQCSNRLQFDLIKFLFDFSHEFGQIMTRCFHVIMSYRHVIINSHLVISSSHHYITSSHHAIVLSAFIFDWVLLPRPRSGWRGIVFIRSVCLSVCLCVCVSMCLCVCVYVCLCVCVSVCPANILVFYFSVIGRDIDLKFTQDAYMVVFNSLKMSKVTGTVHCFLKVQSYHKNFFS